ncbi:Oxygen tolerance [Pseudoxanthobacter soli DSM 19599]|uniref:Oxygen tolerance n=1 Tax=Pseudoxanthobacter soli DSM 19599 TaxID=1123029 RepID=A0A1M7ZRP4_9HYPH|nr:BatD family protein [Pseudoxanthobacter soli]SHO67489.1 Oxygen tolerance [Pseudoxanthobacter soli DSM 19599]
MTETRIPSPAARTKRRSASRLKATVAAAALATLISTGAAFAAGVKADVDRSEIETGDTLQYVITVDGAAVARRPDLRPLDKDFDLLDAVQQSQTNIINGQKSQSLSWVITLAPKRTGTLTIPSLTVGSDKTQPIEIQVSKPDPNRKAENRQLFLETDVAKGSVFAQSDVPMTVRVFDGVGIRSGSLSEPKADGATFTPQGEPKSREQTIGGRRYHVIEQNYIMRPQRSGKIEIGPITLDATVPGQRRRQAGMPPGMEQFLSGNGFDSSIFDDMFGSARNVTVRSEPVTVDVQARPADAKGWFLPSSKVTLTETWTPATSTARVGETLTRTIRLQADGATPNQLPPMTVADADGVRQYEEASRNDTTGPSTAGAAVLEKTISVVPTRAGPVTLPAIDVPWWNTKTNRQEVATLPAVTFTVQPGANGDTGTPAPVAAVPATQSAAPAGTPPAPSLETQSLLERARDIAKSPLAIGGAAVVLALIAAALLWPRRRKAAGGTAQTDDAFAPSPAAAPDDLKAAAIEIEAAARADDAARTHRALLAWTRAAGRGAHKPLADPLEAIRTRELRAAAEALGRRLYAPETAPWDGRAFLKAFRTEQDARRPLRRPSGATLAPLYPEAG